MATTGISSISRILPSLVTSPLPGQTHTKAPLLAFFPAMPRLLRLGIQLGLPPVVTGLIVSFIAGGIAVVFLSRLANHYIPGLGPKAGLSFVAAPPAIFLVAPYTGNHCS